MSQLTPEQFAKLYDAHVDKVYRFLLTKTSSKETAQDLASESFMKAWDYIQRDRNEEIRNFQAFIFRIARNTVIDFYRKKSSSEVMVDDEMMQFSNIPDASMDISAQAMLASDVSQIKRYLTEMNQDYADVLTLHYIEDLSVADVAKVFDKSEGAVRVMLSRALTELRKKMSV